MKEKIMLFVIGLLVGAVISTGAFFVYTKATCNNNHKIGMPGGNPPSMPNGQNSQNGQPSDMPNNDNTQNSSNTQNSNS